MGNLSLPLAFYELQVVVEVPMMKVHTMAL